MTDLELPDREAFEQFIARQNEKPSNSLFGREKIEAITNYLEGKSGD